MIKKKKLNLSETLLFTPHFPYNTKSKGGYKVILGVGGNMGDVLRRFEHLFWYFKHSPFLRICETSPVLKNPPFGYTRQDDFYKAIVVVETRLTPKVLLRYLLDVERRFGRKRSFKDAPRTLDIDMLCYEDVRMQTKGLTLPHMGWDKRRSVLVPLTYLSQQRRRFCESNLRKIEGLARINN